MKRIMFISFVVFVLAISIYQLLPSDTVTYPAGEQVTPELPVQDNLNEPETFEKGDYTLEKVAHFKIEARVLSRREYWFGRETDLSPVDFALGWGPMSDQKVIDKIEISQRNRWYHWRTEKLPIPRRTIETNSANMHLIPADKTIKKKLLSVVTGQAVKIDGYLVNVTGKDGWEWETSMTRKDKGDGGCEIIYVENFSEPEI